VFRCLDRRGGRGELEGEEENLRKVPTARDAAEQMGDPSNKEAACT
jgi:hypothetical protein